MEDIKSKIMNVQMSISRNLVGLTDLNLLDQVVKDVDKLISDHKAVVETMQNKIEELKCCGNCKYWTWAEIGECPDPDERVELLAGDYCTQWTTKGIK